MTVISRLLAAAGLFVAVALAATPGLAEKRPLLRLAGLPVLETAALIDMLETRALSAVADEVSFIPWNNPDQLRAMLVSGQVDVAVIPSNVAAALYNKGIGIRLLMVTEANGLLSILSAGRRLTDISALRGQRIAVPFRNDMPDIILSRLLRQAGLDPEQDVKRVYAASPVEAVQLLLLGRAGHAFLAEPMTTLAELRSRKFIRDGKASADLHRSPSVEAMWSKSAGAGRGPFVAAIAVSAAVQDDTTLMATLTGAYRTAFEKMKSDPGRAAGLLQQHFPQLKAGLIAKAFAGITSRVHPAASEKEAILSFFGQILAEYPKALGGRLPDDGIFVVSRP